MFMFMLILVFVFSRSARWVAAATHPATPFAAVDRNALERHNDDTNDDTDDGGRGNLYTIQVPRGKVCVPIIGSRS